MMRRTIKVPGKPVPQGSLRPMVNKHTGKSFTPQANKVLTHRADIQRQWGEPTPVTGAVDVAIQFVFAHPKSHYLPEAKTKERPALTVLKPEWANQHLMTGKPDIDKCARTVLDALTGYAYVDDEQVATLTLSKVWAWAHERVGHTTIDVLSHEDTQEVS